MSRGLRLPRGKTLSDKGIRPSFLTKKEAEDFQVAKRKYNDRVRKNETRAALEFSTDRETIRRTGYYGVPVYKKLTEVGTKREYDALMKLMTRPQDKTLRRIERIQHDAEFKQTLLMVLDQSYGPSADDFAEMREIIQGMTGREIVEFRLNNPDLVRDWFWRYKHREGKLAKGEAPPDDSAEVRDIMTEQLLEALRVYKK